MMLNDRKSYEDSAEIYKFLKETYSELGFNIVELPKVAIINRANFIESYLSSCID